MGDHVGHDGLRIHHLDDAEIKNGRVVFERTPCLILVPETLSKTDHAWFTFLGPEGCSYLEAYFRKRAERGEVLTPESPVIRSTKAGQSFMRTPSVYRLLRVPMQAAGVKAMPYIWRSYFDTRAMLAESKGLIRDYRQFFMGHTGDIEHAYTLHKDLSGEVIEAMRRGYELTLPFLETATKTEAPNPMLKLTESLLKAAGQDPKAVDLGTMNESAIVDLLTEEIARRVQAATPPPAVLTPDAPTTQPRPRQMVVEAASLATLLGQGWLFRAALDGGKAIVESTA